MGNEAMAHDSPITTYATEISHWEPWQHAYRYGLFLIFPPEPLRSTVNHLRSVYDSVSQAICDAHITLTRPLPRPISETDWQQCAALARTFSAFSIQYGPLRHYLPHPGVCLTIEPQDILDQLLECLESAAIFREAAPRPYPFSAHMTIAEFISVEQTHTLMETLPEQSPVGSFHCQGVAYAVPDEHFHVTERRMLRFQDRL
jgi:2'-5' RNA ligase